MAKSNWRTEKPYIDETGLHIANQLVIAKDEEKIQQMLVNELGHHATGRIIEFGYGLGFAYLAVRKSPHFSEHWVIEGNIHLSARCLSATVKDSQHNLPIVVCDTWENAASWLPQHYFDAVVFDPYPFDEDTNSLESWNEKFRYIAKKSKPTLEKIIRKEGVIGFINFDPQCFSENDLLSCFGENFALLSTHPVVKTKHQLSIWTIRRI